jgi:hypothetical protein
MPFFDESETRPRQQPKSRRRFRRDEEGRPTLFVPAYLPTDEVIAVSDEVAVAMHGIACYPRGFAFSLETTTRYVESVEDEANEDMHGPFSFWAARVEGSARFGIEYSDGRRGTLDERWPRPTKSREITIQLGGGGGGGGSWRADIWVQPLPPPGPVTFAVEWGRTGIPETLHTLDGELFREAAARAKRVFPPRRRRTR